MKQLFALLLLSIILPVNASLKVATASNFKITLIKVVELYSQQSDQKILISSAATGTLYNQISHGAPFDLFLSADKDRAELIEQSKLGIKGSRFTYARGKLAFWLPDSETEVNKKSLIDFEGRIAIANPKLAPYGLASKQALEELNLWNKFSYIQGNNIAQTYQFIDTGNIGAGFVALTLLLQNKETQYYLLPIDSYKPILQQGVMLSATKNKDELQKFVDFLQSEAVKHLIRSQGYL
jgi:molybdate transport system substrate-binding protein